MRRSHTTQCDRSNRNMSKTSAQADTTMDAKIEVRNTSVRYGMERGESRVLNNININVRRNEILGIVGESGSGKSMFASALLDAVPEPGVVTGEISYQTDDGEEINVLDLSKKELRRFRWKEIAMVFQGAMSSFNPVRTIQTHFVETLEAHEYDIDSGMERARRLLSDLYLEPDRIFIVYPHELSGGMRQRVLIALSMLLEPDVLVMDEPTAALDLLMQRSIVSMIRELCMEHDITIIFITHDLPLVADLADRIGVMYAFEIVELGPAQRLLEHPTHPYTRALLKSVPTLTTSIEKMEPIAGQSPDPVNIPSGCSYRQRCPLATELCQISDPDAMEVGENHVAFCHHWEDSAEMIPLEFKSETDPPTEETTRDGPTGEPLISLSGVEVHFEQDKEKLLSFGDADLVRAVDGVSLDIFELDCVVLVGESGCGKTTLGRTAIGVQEPTGGSVSYRGQDIWKSRRRLGDIAIPFNEIRRSLQIVHQDPGSSLNGYRTVRSILEDPLKRWHDDLNFEDRLQQIYTLLAYVGMTPPEDYASRYPHQLSGGEKQRVALIRSMMMRPDFILADEPVSALDVSLRIEMMDLMVDLQKIFNTSYLFISHDLSNARYISELIGGRIGVMYLGEIVEIGPPQAVISSPKHPYTKALKWATVTIEAASTSDDHEELPLRKIDIPEPTNPPSGCRFHTRCPEAREVCRTQRPELNGTQEDSFHTAACFREDEDHEYWESEPIVD